MDNIWTQDRIDALAKLWADGLSTAEIGRRLGITKNSVVGKPTAWPCHRALRR